MFSILGYRAWKKKNYRYLAVCALACISNCVYFLFRTPQLANTMLFDILRMIYFPIILALFGFTVFMSCDSVDRRKHNVFLSVFSGAVVVVQTVRNVLFHGQSQRLLSTEDFTSAEQLIGELQCVYNICDVIYVVLYLAMIATIALALREPKQARTA